MNGKGQKADPSRRCDVCGSSWKVVARANVNLRPTIAPWIELVCGRCCVRFSVKSSD